MAGVSLQAEPPEAHVLEGGRLVLSCAVAEGSGPLSFSWHRRNLTRAVGAGPRYELPAARLGDGDHYRCTVSNGVSTASSPQLLVTVVGERGAARHGRSPLPSPPPPHPHPIP